MPIYRAYDASAGAYPPARLPAVPRADRPTLSGGASTRYPSCFDATLGTVFARGRYALLHALRSVGVDEHHAVALPAYHCRTMIDPALRLGAETCFYALRPDLAPDLDRLADRLARAVKPVRALLLPHYFGFVQDIEPVLEFCRRRGIALIEDCCHTYFGGRAGRVVGSFGDCAIGSPGKFFATDEGGTFRSNTGGPAPALSARPWSDELRAAYRSADAALALRRRRRAGAGLDTLAAEFEAVRARHPSGPGDLVADEGGRLSEHYDPGQETLAATRWSRLLMRRSDIERLCERRRAHFTQLLQAVATLPNCRPLFTALPDGVVPYMFPLLIEQPGQRFHWLKHLGVPMFRWDELADSDCAVSAQLRLHLVHLPCHQAMLPGDMAWLIGALTLALQARIDPADENRRRDGAP